MKAPDLARGFSLIELLVVIAIVGIVVSMALLSLGILGDDRQLQTEARRVMALLEVAEDEATEDEDVHDVPAPGEKKPRGVAAGLL